MNPHSEGPLHRQLGDTLSRRASSDSPPSRRVTSSKATAVSRDGLQPSDQSAARVQQTLSISNSHIHKPKPSLILPQPFRTRKPWRSNADPRAFGWRPSKSGLSFQGEVRVYSDSSHAPNCEVVHLTSPVISSALPCRVPELAATTAASTQARAIVAALVAAPPQATYPLASRSRSIPRPLSAPMIASRRIAYDCLQRHAHAQRGHVPLQRSHAELANHSAPAPPSLLHTGGTVDADEKCREGRGGGRGEDDEVGGHGEDDKDERHPEPGDGFGVPRAGPAAPTSSSAISPSTCSCLRRDETRPGETPPISRSTCSTAQQRSAGIKIALLFKNNAERTATKHELTQQRSTGELHASVQARRSMSWLHRLRLGADSGALAGSIDCGSAAGACSAAGADSAVDSDSDESAGEADHRPLHQPDEGQKRLRARPASGSAPLARRPGGTQRLGGSPFRQAGPGGTPRLGGSPFRTKAGVHPPRQVSSSGVHPPLLERLDEQRRRLEQQLAPALADLSEVLNQPRSPGTTLEPETGQIAGKALLLCVTNGAASHSLEEARDLLHLASLNLWIAESRRRVEEGAVCLKPPLAD